MNYIIGQILGLCSTVCTIILPFFRKKWQILALNIAVNALLTLNFLLIGQFGSAAFLCLVAVGQSIVSIVHNVKKTKVTTPETILFFILYVGFGFFGIVTAPGFVMELNRTNLLELLPIIGALMLMISVFAQDEQTTRKWLLANALIWTVYTAIVGSTAFFTDLVAAISTASALYKYRKEAE
ncbi:MAG: YgjV family protein [Oscillospiraceae bacterium]|nr:YgjV family protein [Oscillospiraceae bacterium]